MNSLIRTLLLAAFLALTSVSVDAMSNAELLARGLPLNPPHRRSCVVHLLPPPQSTIYPTSNGGYASTCKDITLTGLNSHVISADCQKFNGNYISGRTININGVFLQRWRSLDLFKLVTVELPTRNAKTVL
ncbi:hypothetical protein BT96DRAFT_1002248 [Gymnopus androsaceus JB14]|uniref:Cyanovirin-N domain-containing protein n=1 Tax=Gymnopus androsaceus JB14 TaxID=1447944 RepID=A0A6A4GXK8_9AGAR|nr:hypothetical protein BT96DRAFT_1002248 [Gymnopus androsaceus JB14]